MSDLGLGIIGFCIIIAFLVVILRKKLHVVPALIIIPLVGALIAGFSLSQVGDFVLSGLEDVSGTIAMFTFAVMYFGLLMDAGFFDPLVSKAVGYCIKRPAMVFIITGLIAIITHLDGSGATTVLITVTAMLPIYDALKIDRKILALMIALPAGVMNMVPWGGGAVRIVAVMEGATFQNLYNPMIPAQIAGLIACFIIAWYFGKKIKVQELEIAGVEAKGRIDVRWFANLTITALVIVIMLTGYLDPAYSFMLGFALALIINARSYKDQSNALVSHAKEALPYVTILFSAGVLTGILEGSGMMDSMAKLLVSIIPESFGPAFAPLMAFLSGPMRVFFTPDALYFGILPVWARAAASFGIDPLLVARASLLGSAGWPICPTTGAFYMLVGMCGIEVGEHMKHTFGWLLLVLCVVAVTAIATGAII